MSIETFPGADWYEPTVSASATATTLHMTEDEKAEARQLELLRSKRGFGFVRKEDS